MLHIILLLLKIIGWIVLAILGILVLLLLVVFLAAFKYHGTASASGTVDSIRGELKFSWFFRIIQGFVKYQKDALEYEVKIFSKRIVSSEGEVEKELENEVELSSLEDAVQEEILEEKEETTKPIASEPVQETSVKEAAIVHPEEKISEDRSEMLEEQPSENHSETSEERKSIYQKLSEMCQKMTDKISQIFQKIKYTITKICDKMKALSEKKEMLQRFIENEVHVAAFHRAVRELKRLIRFLKPKYLNVNLHFGFEDPYVTGQVLAAAAILYPFTEDHLSLEPDFEQAVVEGDVEVKGRIRLIYFVIVGAHLVLNKNIRQTYKDIRKLMNR